MQVIVHVAVLRLVIFQSILKYLNNYGFHFVVYFLGLIT